MNYQKLFQFGGVSNVGLIGTGAFGRSFLVQSGFIPNIKVPVVCDQNIDSAKKACLQAGLMPQDLIVCDTESDTNDAIVSGKTALVSDARLLMDTPIEVIIEATGVPEAGAIHAHTAIENGKHIVMVTKETDCVVGPVLNRRAEHAGVVYTPADGDQPSLLIGLISWAEMLGFEIVCAGKASELDFVYETDSHLVCRGGQKVVLKEENIGALFSGSNKTMLKHRHQILATLPRFSTADLCEMVIVINNTGLGFDAPRLHAPVASLKELPELMCEPHRGGILTQQGVVDMVNCLRRAEEISVAGGVFIVVTCRGRQTWQLLKDKGHLVSRDGTRAMIFRPYHLLGVEMATSVLAANHLGISTGGTELKPRVDLGLRAKRKLPQGYRLNLEPDHTIAGVTPEILPAEKMAAHSSIPYYMAAGLSLNQSVAEGQPITYGMIDDDPQACLWKLRREQDELFGM